MLIYFYFSIFGLPPLRKAILLRSAAPVCRVGRMLCVEFTSWWFPQKLSTVQWDRYLLLIQRPYYLITTKDRDKECPFLHPTAACSGIFSTFPLITSTEKCSAFKQAAAAAAFR